MGVVVFDGLGKIVDAGDGFIRFVGRLGTTGKVKVTCATFGAGALRFFHDRSFGLLIGWFFKMEKATV
jgi:hypothetical protein